MIDYTDQLYDGVKKGDLEQVRLALKNKADVNYKKNGVSLSLTAVACGNGNLEIIKELARHNSNLKDNDLLNMASYHGKLDVIAYLLDEQGLEVTKNDNKALIWACESSKLKAVKLLIERGAEISCRDYRIFRHSLFKENNNAMKFLLKEVITNSKIETSKVMFLLKEEHQIVFKKMLLEENKPKVQQSSEYDEIGL